LSPGYDLSGALAASRGGIVNFHSENDWVILGLGTQTWGTIDGEKTDSAGRVGFLMPSEADSEGYLHLYQVGWSPGMAKRGHFGGHGTSGSLWFVRDYVAPLITSDFAPETIDSLGKPVASGSTVSGSSTR
jgi:hypothetical protein